MIELTNDSFKEAISSNQASMIVYFYAPWCGPCRALSPFISRLENEISNVTFCKANVEECESVANELGVQNLPCVVFFKNGKEVERVIGNNQSKIREITNSLVG